MTHKPCPAVTTVEGVEVRCDRDEGHPETHVAAFGAARIVWPNMER